MGSVILRAMRPFAKDTEPRSEWFTVTASGGPVTVTGAVFSADHPNELKLTLSRDIAPGETVTVSYRRPEDESGPWDVTGHQLEDIVDRPVATDAPPAAAAVTGVEVVSDAGDDNTYALDDAIRIAVTFSEAVDVTGAPRLKIDMDPADRGEKWATYDSGSGTSELTFSHTVVEPDVSTRGIAVLANTLDPNGGAIRSAATQTDAELAHDGLDHDPDHKVDWRQSPPEEELPSLGVSDARAAEGEAVEFTVSLSAASGEEVTVDYATSDGTAESATDFTAASGTLTFAANARSRTVRVETSDDSADEEDETFTLTLSNPAGATLDDDEATGTIEDDDEAADALTAEFRDVPTEHGGRGSEFSFELRFSENFGGRLDYKVLRDEALQATNARVTGAKRAAQGQNQGWIVTVRTGSFEDVTVSLSATADCGATSAVCTPDGRPLSNSPSARLIGPAGISVADARAEESAGAVLAFAVTLSRAATSALSVDYATSDGSARAGEDYGGERDFALGFLSSFAQPMGVGPAGAVPMGGVAMGGATSMGMGSHTAGAAMGAPGAGMPGMGGSPGAMGMPGMGGAGAMGTADMTGQMGMAAQPMGYGAARDAHETGLFGTVVGHDPLANSEFELNREARGGTLSLWSRNSRSHFSGMENALSLNGDVRTSMFGADYARGSLTVGLSVGRTLGLGGYSGPSSGQMTTSMTGFYPWVGYQVNDKLSVWGVTGYGTGMLSLKPGSAAALETGVSMAMSAAGSPSGLDGVGSLTARVAPSWGGQARGGAEALWGGQMAYGMGSHQMYGSGDRVDADVGYGLPVGARSVGTPKVGVSTSMHGRDYRVGYGLGVLEQGKLRFELAAEAQRRETPMQGEASNGLLGRATIGW